MTRLKWDLVGERKFETGVDRGVLYLRGVSGAYDTGVVWNGLTAVNESPTGGEANPQYADNIKYLNLFSAEEFEATIEAFTYPDEFMQCDGTAEPEEGVFVAQQSRTSFGFSYRSLVGNDVAGTDLGYKIHLVYGAMAAPSEKSRATVNDSPEAITFSWAVTTTPEFAGDDLKPTAHIIIDSTKVTAAQLKTLEDMIYGSETNTTATLPTPEAVIAIFATP